MTRDELIKFLKDSTEGVSPFQDIKSDDDFVKYYFSRFDELALDAFDILLDILLEPPDNNILGRISYDDFEFELEQALEVVGRKDPFNSLRKLRCLLERQKARPVIISIIGGLRQNAGFYLLEPVLDLEFLSDDELINLADAFSEIGGAKAIELLEKMRLKYSDRSQDLLRNIEICLQRANHKIKEQG
ncbi:MAG: hypothetical protein ACM3UZ_02215 [Acidobacteriota bacterium]